MPDASEAVRFAGGRRRMRSAGIAFIMVSACHDAPGVTTARPHCKTESPMPDDQRRLEELETRTAFHDHTLEQLGRLVAEQGRLIGELEARIERLETQLARAIAEGTLPPVDEPPPHY